MATGSISRDKRNAMIGGVCAGLARHFGWSVTGTRVVYVFVSLISAAFPGILVYLILWILLPESDFS
jgi:phage shock protein PspC (stress-responsive transcriptional regulator)